MNKYQEAWRSCFELSDITINNFDLVPFDMGAMVLKELVDKETPVKPIIKRSTHGHLMWGTCDVCKSEEAIWFGQRCNNNECGQRIDWSDEE